MMTQTRLRQLYADFWQQYSSVLPGIVTRYPVNDSPFSVQQSGDVFSIELVVDFNGLRYRSSAGQRNIALKIRGTKHCKYDRNDQSTMTRSNVNMNYFVRDGKTLTLVRSLHYDYEANLASLKNHPLYHCHINNDQLGGDFFGRKDFKIERQEKKKVYQQIRIPTANMDMISVLLSIAADHSSPEEFEKVLEVYDDRKWHSELPHISHHGKFSPDKCFRSRAWYIG